MTTYDRFVYWGNECAKLKESNDLKAIDRALANWLEASIAYRSALDKITRKRLKGNSNDKQAKDNIFAIEQLNDLIFMIRNTRAQAQEKIKSK